MESETKPSAAAHPTQRGPRQPGETLAGPSRWPHLFLHGGWRCGSTYIWSKFRGLPNAACFYEPFHEGLSRATRKRIRRNTPVAWKSRHPILERPYWDEYLPLLRKGIRRGVRGHRRDFAVGRYFPGAEGLAPELSYLETLLGRAQGLGRQAVLGFSRSLARAAPIKQVLGGYHAVILRDPRQQWLSGRSYRIEDGSVYFELGHFLILALAAAGSPAALFAQRLGLPRPPPGSFRQQFDFLRAALGSWSDDLSYRAFLGVLLLSHATALPAADLTIDMDKLSHSAVHRKAVHASILLNMGMDVDFRDCRMHVHDPSQVDLDFDAVEENVSWMLRSCGATPVALEARERATDPGDSEVHAAAVVPRWSEIA
ncbi:MAG TPA: hypothetical protein VGL55_15505 [Steroidobacteraceae bacterium]|jgi:hypothetical protein